MIRMNYCIVKITIKKNNINLNKFNLFKLSMLHLVFLESFLNNSMQIFM
jgi:hypothetical protein